MNELVHSLIHDKAINRRINILEILDNGQQLVSSKYLADQLHCSVRSISSDISRLKDDLLENWYIIGVRAKGFILIKPIEDSIFPIIKSYIAESAVYKIMIGIFNNKYYTFEKWSQTLYMNTSTLKKSLNKHKIILKKSKLDIEFREIRLKGEELNIRQYYFALFYNIQTFTNESPLPTELRNKLLSIFRHTENEVQFDFKALCIIIYVVIHRFFYKHYITKKIDSLPISTSAQLNCFKKIIKTVEEYYMIKFPEKEKDLLYKILFLVSTPTIT
ncbi:helix-turn-helix domain-containing protein, partial [Bacillus cereus]|nr:helix-turn-helix domain-containing protein [Bacillus cereus]